MRSVRCLLTRNSIPSTLLSSSGCTMKAFPCFVLVLTSIAIGEMSLNCNSPNWHSLETLESARLNCGQAFKKRCLCSKTCYDGQYGYVVNCTNSGFNDTTPLEHLPNETQFLIFTGNNLPELPWNIFGTLDTLPNLRFIDMSSNKIREIRGKAYHHVQHVQRLILDFNELTLDSGRSHPRVFSNFVALQELHLTDAFEDGHPRDLAETLRDIFVSSNLTRLIKLHLEQNEISEFRDANVFCDLPNLYDLYLGDNALTALHFNLTCLQKLRFLDLQRNMFKSVKEDDLKAMDVITKNNRSLQVDFSKNPFECSCKLNSLIKWMEGTKVFIRNKDKLQCLKNHRSHPIHETANCTPKLTMAAQRGMTTALFLLSTMLICLVCALIYVQRKKIHTKIEPLLDTINKRVRYTSIATGDTREEA